MKKAFLAVLFFSIAPLRAMTLCTYEQVYLETLIQRISNCLAACPLAKDPRNGFMLNDNSIFHVVSGGYRPQNEALQHAARYVVLKTKIMNDAQSLARLIQELADLKNLGNDKRRWGSYRMATLFLNAHTYGIDLHALLSLKNSKGQTPLAIAQNSCVHCDDYHMMVALLSNPLAAATLPEAHDDFIHFTQHRKGVRNIPQFLFNREHGIK